MSYENQPPGGPYGPPPQQQPGMPQPQGMYPPQQGPHPQPQGMYPPQQGPHPPQQQGIPQYPGGPDPVYQVGYGQGGYGQYPPQMAMPGSVRKARVMAYILFGIVLASTVWVSSDVGPDAGGQLFGKCLFSVGVFICALRFSSGGGPTRVTAITLCWVQVAAWLGALSQGAVTGGLGFIVLSVAIAVGLTGGSAKAWFLRPRA